MNCKEMMQIPELENVLKLKAGEKGLQRLVRWIYFADCLQCIKSEYKIEDYIHGGELVILTNRSVTDDNEKLMALIRQMDEHEISALGINEGQISEELMKYCEEKELPLFELPEKYPLIDLSQIMCRRLVLEEQDRNAAEQLFSSVLDAEHLNRERVMAQARYLNINLEGSFCVAEFAFENVKSEWENDDTLAQGQNIKRMINTEFSFYTKEDILILPQAGSILVLIPVSQLDDNQIRNILMALIPVSQNDEEEVREILIRIVKRVQRENEMKLCVGVGNSIAYLDEAKRSRNEAAAAIRAAAVTDMQGPVYFYKEQGIYTLLSHMDDTRVLDEYVEKQLGKLFRYDEINTGNLCETLENYLAHNCNAKKTAETMFLHRNTMNYRLKKISELLNCDFEDMDKCLALKLAFMIVKYRNR